MTNDTQSILESIHASYCALTGTQPKFKIWERSWYSFLQAGFNQGDLECVLSWLLMENKRNDYKRSLSLLKLLADDFQTFDSYLSEARAKERNHKPTTPKQQVVSEFRRFSESDSATCAKRVGDIINHLGKP